MKQQKELVLWLLLFTISAIGFFLLIKRSPSPSEPETNISTLFLAGPSFFATMALASFFLICRFVVLRNKSTSPSRFRHVLAAALVSLAALISWEFSQMFLIERTFAYSPMMGTFGGALAIILIWFLTRKKLHQIKHP